MDEKFVIVHLEDYFAGLTSLLISNMKLRVIGNLEIANQTKTHIYDVSEILVL